MKWKHRLRLIALRAMIFLCIASLLTGLSFLTWHLGYQSDIREHVWRETAGLGGVLDILMAGTSFVMMQLTALGVISFWRRKGFIECLMLLMFLSGYHYYCQFQVAKLYGLQHIQTTYHHQQQVLGRLAGMLEQYQQTHHQLPANLHQLFIAESLPPSWPVPVNYLILPADQDSSSGTWLLWSAGPDSKFDLLDSPELTRSLQARVYGAMAVSPWLINQAYDPTNGTQTTGDMLWSMKHQADNKINASQYRLGLE